MNDYTKKLKRLKPIIIQADDGSLDVFRIRDVYTNEKGKRLFHIRRGGDEMIIKEEDTIPYADINMMVELGKERDMLEEKLEQVKEILRVNHALGGEFES